MGIYRESPRLVPLTPGELSIFDNEVHFRLLHLEVARPLSFWYDEPQTNAQRRSNHGYP